MDILLLKPSEVATRLGLGRAHVYQLLATGELPSIRLGRCIRVPVSALNDWVTDQIAKAA